MRKLSRLLKRSVVSSLLEIGLGVLVGYLTYVGVGRGDPASAMMGIVIGILTALLASQIASRIEQEADSARIEATLSAVLSRLGDVLSSHHTVASVLRHGVLRCPRERVTSLFQQILWGTQKRYWATSYHSEIQHHYLATAIQEAKVKVEGVEIRRVFIVDTEEELTTILGLIQVQRNAGIDARWLFRRDIERDPILRDRVTRFPSLDFTVVDSRLLLLLYLDESRNTLHAEVRFQDSECAEYEEAFRALFPLSSVPTVAEVPAQSLSTREPVS